MEFKLWFEQQSCAGGYGPVFHGSRKDFEQFDPSVSNFGGTIYFTSNPAFAHEFATNSAGAGDSYAGFVYTACLNIQKTFDPRNPSMLEQLKPILADNIQKNIVDQTTGIQFKIYDNLPKPDKTGKITTVEDAVDWYIWRITNGSWRIIESKTILDYLKSQGYDSIKTVERGAENIAVFDPSRIKVINKEPVQ